VPERVKRRDSIVDIVSQTPDPSKDGERKVQRLGRGPEPAPTARTEAGRSDRSAGRVEPTAPPKKQAPKKAAAKKKERPPLRPLTDEPDLMGAVYEDIGAMGVVGERTVALTLYVVGTSRLLQRPLSAILQASSAAGKSYLLATVVKLFPPEDVLDTTHMSAKSLYHYEEDIAHKWVISGERPHKQDDSNADATAALRQLKSEGRITEFVTQGSGEHKTVTKETVGPIAHTETTTHKRVNIFAEDLNRSLLLRPDESAEQTRRIMKARAKEYTTGKPVDQQAIIDRHQAFQRQLRKLKDRRVFIPFADHLADKIPDSKIEMRRAISQILSMTEAVALLHEHKRKRMPAPDGRIVATEQDYAIARELLLEPIRETAGGSARAHRAAARLLKEFPDGFDSNDASTLDDLFKNKMTRDRTLKAIVALGILRKGPKGVKGSPTKYEWTGSLDVLPEGVAGA
jgi:hypothetical protein